MLHLRNHSFATGVNFSTSIWNYILVVFTEAPVKRGITSPECSRPGFWSAGLRGKVLTCAQTRKSMVRRLTSVYKDTSQYLHPKTLYRPVLQLFGRWTVDKVMNELCDAGRSRQEQQTLRIQKKKKPISSIFIVNPK